MISTTLLLWPSNSRSYLMALHRLNLERDAQLRQSALLHAHQVESARTAYEQEKNKVEDEARNSKRIVRERLLSAVEDRRRRLRDDKESGEGMSGKRWIEVFDLTFKIHIELMLFLYRYITRCFY